MKGKIMDNGTPTVERLRHGAVEVIETMQAGLYAWKASTPAMLHRYWRDQLLGPEGDYSLARARFDAGDRLAGLYETTGLRQRLMGVYGPRSHAHEEPTDDQNEARVKFQALVKRLQALSPSAASAVVNLCIHDLEPIDRRELIRGLDCLARHWGMA